MQLYNNSHPYYCGIDRHAKSLYICMLDDKGDTVIHKNIKACPDTLMSILKPYIGNVVTRF